jgi:endonuclease YncB( thermonuclease family)
MSRHVLILLAFAAAGPAAAAPLPEMLVAGGKAHVSQVLDAMTLRLDDGRTVRLAAIETPQPELPRLSQSGEARPAPRRPPAAAAADRATVEIAQGHDVTLYYEERRNDRYGRLVAHVVVLPDLWLQQELLRRGLARVHTTADTAASAPMLLRTEAEARAQRRGLWSQNAFQLRQPDELGRFVDSFQIVEGRIGQVRRTAGQTTLYFADMRGRPADVVILSTARRRFREAGIDLAELAERPLRIRGWVRWQNGPVIDVDHPAQIEVIGPP